jgi:NAD(P)-dependent dehydrogenase (short-subunit alcohol dehydrogenase family)
MSSDDVTAMALQPGAILLTGKTALITGGGAGIGRGIALGFAAFGADVAILDINAEAAETVASLVRAKGRRAIAITADVTDRAAVRAGIDRIMAELGRLDILVNNAGGTRPLKLLDMSDKQADRRIDLNLTSLFTTTQAAAQAMIAGGRGGAIINIASIEGLRAAPLHSVYAACKAGMVNLTRTAALELAEHNIRVNCIAPDVVMTEAMARNSPLALSPEFKKTHATYFPLGRTGNFDDCAGTAIFLASAMSAYVTGVTINVDGGTWASSGWTRDKTGKWQLFTRDFDV